MRKKMRIKWKLTKLSPKKKEKKKRKKDNFWDEVGEICIIKLCMKNYIIYNCLVFVLVPIHETLSRKAKEGLTCKNQYVTTKCAFGLSVLSNPCVMCFLVGLMGTIHSFTKLSKS